MSHDSPPPTRDHSPSRMLVIESNPDLRELEEVILRANGYQVETPPTYANPVEVAARTTPDVIILGITHPGDSRSWQILDQLQANARTRTIPVVVISSSESAAAAAQAAPVVGSISGTVVAPYDIQALEAAVSHALKNPPPAAAISPTNRQPSPTIVFAADALGANARQIALGTVQRLRQIEPYRSRFTELTKGLVDDIGTMLGAVIEGLRGGVPPRDVFRAPAIRRAIETHVRLRESQGLTRVAAARENLALRDEIDSFVQGLVGQQGFTEREASDVIEGVHAYVNELIRVVGEEIAAGK